MIRLGKPLRPGVAGLFAAAVLVTVAAVPAHAGVPQDGKGDTATFLGTPCLNFHTLPSLSSPVTYCIEYGHSSGVVKSTTGDWVNGLWGWTNCWDWIEWWDSNEVPHQGWASDGYIYTGKSEC
jgi:hypothetical protein